MGMGTVHTTCSECKQNQFVGKYDWNYGKAKCKYCGGALDETPKPKKAKKGDFVVDELTRRKVRAIMDDYLGDIINETWNGNEALFEQRVCGELHIFNVQLFKFNPDDPHYTMNVSKLLNTFKVPYV